MNTHSIETKLDNLNTLIQLLRDQLTLGQRAQRDIMRSIGDMLLQSKVEQNSRNHKNPLNFYGAKCFSQTDEDGITIEIINRLGITDGVYAELGVGNGLENNSLILAAMGWKGFWIGGEDLCFYYPKSNNFAYLKTWITRENVIEIFNIGLNHINNKEVNVCSIDLDGNDIYIAEEILKNKIRPNLFIVEYNAQFIPPVKFQIKYNAKHRWESDNYFGAALTNFEELFRSHDYRLICCNSHTGANAFFIDNKFSHLFQDVPNNLRDIYCPPHYHLYTKFAHPQSVRVVEKIFADNAGLQ